MPSNWLYIDTNFPTFTGEEETEEKISTIQNYLFMLVEQLRYSLRNLDTRNMNQTALKEFTGGLTDPIYRRIEDEAGNITELAVTAKGIAARVSDAEGNISALQQTATSLSSQIQDANGNISVLQQTAASIQSTVSNQAGQISTLQQTAASIQSTVSNQAGQISTLQQTAASIQSTVTNQAGQISSIRQSVDSIELGVYNGDGYSTLSIYRDGVEVSSENITFRGMVSFEDLSTAGRTVIYGGNVLTDSLWLDTLYGNTIYLKDGYGRIAAMFTLMGASSYEGQKILVASGAIELISTNGDIYFSAGSGGALKVGDYEVQVTGDLIPNSANRYTCGSYGFPWMDIYSQDGTISSSDARGKTDVDYDMGRYSGLFDRLRPCSFLRKGGTSGRRHHGFIAQEVKSALEAEGMTGQDFAGYVEWRDGEEYGCGLRHEELLAMLTYEVQALKKQNAEITRRLGI